MSDISALVDAINQLSRRNLIDYLIVIVPVIISVVSIVISICTANRQNRIALFDKRVSVLSLLEQLNIFSENISSINDNKNCALIYHMYNSVFHTNISYNNAESLEKYYNSLQKMMTVLLGAKYLYSIDIIFKANDFLLKLSRLMEKTITGEPFLAEKDAFCQSWSQFYTQYIDVLIKETQL